MDDFEEPTVTIRSTSGQWVQEGVLARKDPVFRNLGMMHKNGVVTLDQELSTIFETQWPHYLRLKEWMEELQAARQGRAQGMQPARMRDSLRGERAVEGTKVRLVYLHQIEGLLKFIAMPQGWEYCVAVDETTPQGKRLAHLLLMGSRMMAQKLDQSVGTLAKPGDDAGLTLNFLFVLLGTIERANDKRALAIYWGLMQNTLLRTIEEYPGRRVAWPAMLWSDVPVLLRQFSIKDEGLVNFSLFMAGERIDRDLFLTIAREIPVKWKRSYLVGKDETKLDEVRGVELYERVLLSFDDDAEPSMIGLLVKQVNSARGWLLSQTSLAGLVYDTNSSLLRKEGEEAIDWAKRFSKSVGKVGAVRSLLSLLHHMSRVEDESAEEMAATLEEVLEGDVSTPEELVVPNA